MENIFEEKKPKISQTLNVLTILTFIGSALTLLMSVLNYFNAQKSYDQMIEAQSKMEQAPAFVQKMMGPEMLELTRLSLENKLPLMVFNLIGVALCIFGAIEMRRLKKQGFALWIAGEFLPLVISYIILGKLVFNGFAAIGLVFPFVFVALYAFQLKNLR